MSVQAITWAFKSQPKTSSMKLVLLVLGNFADAHGVAYPGQKKIALETGLSVRTVNSALASLEDDGFINRERRSRSDGTRSSDLYTLNLDNVQNLQVGHEDNMQMTTRQHAKFAYQYKPNGLSEPVREPLERAREPTKRKTRIDPDQEINQKQTEYAESKGLWKLALVDEWDRFKNYHIMHDNKFVDWNRAWYNWVTSPYRKASHGNQSGSEGNGTIAFLEKAKARGLGQRKAERGDSGDSAFEDLYPDQGFRTIEGER